MSFMENTKKHGTQMSKRQKNLCYHKNVLENFKER